MPSFFPKNRLEGLSDGVYAVALTLLVLNLKLPSGDLDSAQFTTALIGLIPNALTWLLSFWVILIYWESQARLSQYISRVDDLILRLDISTLAMISLLPFSTSLIAENNQHSLSAVIYTANLWLISALTAWKTSYVVKKRHLQPSDAAQEKIILISHASSAMLAGMSVALLLSHFVPGWNLLVIFIPKIINHFTSAKKSKPN